MKVFIYYSNDTNELYLVNFLADRILWREEFPKKKKIETWAEYVGEL